MPSRQRRQQQQQKSTNEPLPDFSEWERNYKLLSIHQSKKAFPRQKWRKWKKTTTTKHDAELLGGYICGRDANGNFVHDDCVRNEKGRKTKAYLRDKLGKDHKAKHKAMNVGFDQVTIWRYTEETCLCNNGNWETMRCLIGEQRCFATTAKTSGIQSFGANITSYFNKKNKNKKRKHDENENTNDREYKRIKLSESTNNSDDLRGGSYLDVTESEDDSGDIEIINDNINHIQSSNNSIPEEVEDDDTNAEALTDGIGTNEEDEKCETEERIPTYSVKIQQKAQQSLALTNTNDAAIQKLIENVENRLSEKIESNTKRINKFNAGYQQSNTLKVSSVVYLNENENKNDIENIDESIISKSNRKLHALYLEFQQRRISKYDLLSIITFTPREIMQINEIKLVLKFEEFIDEKKNNQKRIRIQCKICGRHYVCNEECISTMCCRRHSLKIDIDEFDSKRHTLSFINALSQHISHHSHSNNEEKWYHHDAEDRVITYIQVQSVCNRSSQNCSDRQIEKDAMYLEVLGLNGETRINRHREKEIFEWIFKAVLMNIYQTIQRPTYQHLSFSVTYVGLQADTYSKGRHKGEMVVISRRINSRWKYYGVAWLKWDYGEHDVITDNMKIELVIKALARCDILPSILSDDIFNEILSKLKVLYVYITGDSKYLKAPIYANNILRGPQYATDPSNPPQILRGISGKHANIDENHVIQRAGVDAMKQHPEKKKIHKEIKAVNTQCIRPKGSAKIKKIRSILKVTGLSYYKLTGNRYYIHALLAFATHIEHFDVTIDILLKTQYQKFDIFVSWDTNVELLAFTGFIEVCNKYKILAFQRGQTYRGGIEKYERISHSKSLTLINKDKPSLIFTLQYFIETGNLLIIKNWLNQQNTPIFTKYIYTLIVRGTFKGKKISFDESVKYIRKRLKSKSQKTSEHMRNARNYNIVKFKKHWNNLLKSERDRKSRQIQQQQQQQQQQTIQQQPIRPQAEAKEVDDDDDDSIYHSESESDYIEVNRNSRNRVIADSDSDDDSDDDDDDDEIDESDDDEYHLNLQIITPVPIPQDKLIAAPTQRYRAKLVLGYLLFNHYPFCAAYHDSYFIKRRSREIFSNDHREGKWFSLYFPDLIIDIIQIDDVYDDNDEQKKKVLNAGNDDVEFIYNKYKTDCRGRKEQQLVYDTSINIRHQWIKIKDWLITYLHSNNQGIIFKDKILDLLVSHIQCQLDLDAYSFINIVQDIEEKVKCHTSSLSSFWNFWEFNQAMVHSSSHGVEGLGNYISEFAKKTSGKPKSQEYIEKKAISKAHLDESKRTMNILGKGLSNKLVDDGRGCLLSNASRDIDRRKHETPKVLLKQSKGREGQKYAEALYINENDIRFNL